MSELIVAKFGGTAMAQPEVVAGIVESRPDMSHIVVSAPGKDEAHDTKVTDLLRQYAAVANVDQTAAASLRDDIIDRYNTAYASLSSSDLRLQRTQAAALLRPTKEKDAGFYESIGEKLSARYFATLIGAQAVSPAVLFESTGMVDYDATREQILTANQHSSHKLVVPGYYGVDAQSKVRLLKRGGSDRTGALYAAALGRDYENWTDVDGIYAADRDIVPHAEVIPELTRDEVREGAHGGNGVLMGDTIIDLAGSDIVTTIKNTFNPEVAGTQIKTHLEQPRKNSVVAVSGRSDLLELVIRDPGMADRRGYAADILAELSRLDMSFEHLPAAQDAFSLTVHAGSGETAQTATRETLQQLADFALGHKLSSRATAEITEQGVVYIVGEALRQPNQRQAATIRTLGTAATHGIYTRQIASPPNSPSLALLVERDDMKKLLVAVHDRELGVKKLLDLAKR